MSDADVLLLDKKKLDEGGKYVGPGARKSAAPGTRGNRGSGELAFSFGDL